jgi:hypothetical protein
MKSKRLDMQNGTIFWLLLVRTLYLRPISGESGNAPVRARGYNTIQVEVALKLMNHGTVRLLAPLVNILL